MSLVVGMYRAFETISTILFVFQIISKYLDWISKPRLQKTTETKIGDHANLREGISPEGIDIRSNGTPK